ncbi:hypothetical protein Bca101_000644 [Brassica carinata]
MSDLPRDIEEEVLCRVPLTSLGLVRSTCKRWNMLSRCDHLFANKHLLAHLAAEEAKKKDHPLVVTMMNYRVELMRLDLSNSEDDVAVVNPEAKLAGLDQIDVREIFHCDGLFLCIPKEDHYRLLVWNPYWGRGQPRWIEHTHNHDLVDTHLFGRLDRYSYGLGYDSSSHYKILRFIDYPPNFVEFKIYDFNSDSWRILDLPPRPDNWNIKLDERGLSLKGSTYWFASEALNFDAICFLVCFDFTTETFSPPLPLPFEAFPDDTLILSSSSSSSSVGGEYPPQLVVLFQSMDTLEIWISNTIEKPNAALSWDSKVFLSANIKQLIHPHWQFLRKSACFFIDQEKKVAVVFDKNARSGAATRDIAYIFVGGGVDDGSSSLTQQVVKESAYPFCYSRACYYVPSLDVPVQTQKATNLGVVDHHHAPPSSILDEDDAAFVCPNFYPNVNQPPQGSVTATGWSGSTWIVPANQQTTMMVGTSIRIRTRLVTTTRLEFPLASGYIEDEPQLDLSLHL